MSDFPTVTVDETGYFAGNMNWMNGFLGIDAGEYLLIPKDRVRATWDVDEAAKAFVLFYDEVREIAPSAVVLVVEVPDAE